MRIEARDNRVIVEPVENPEMSDGGIYTGAPKTSFATAEDRKRGKTKVDQICLGKVVSVGPGKRHPKTGVRMPTGVEIGQYVAFSDTCHRPVGVDNLIHFRSDDVMFVSDEPINSCEVLY